MWISPAYAREYKEWILGGMFGELYGRATTALAKDYQEQHPALIATDLQELATCYYRRGTVSLLEGDSAGWHDVQCGYWAALYRIGFELKAITLPARSAGRSFAPRDMCELVVLLGLARLFSQ